MQRGYAALKNGNRSRVQWFRGFGFIKNLNRPKSKVNERKVTLDVELLGNL